MTIAEQSFDILGMDRTNERRARAWQLARFGFWSGVLAFGVKRRGIVGVLAGALALERLARSLLAFRVTGSRQTLNRGVRITPERQWDRVDQASWESFPASDPPG